MSKCENCIHYKACEDWTYLVSADVNFPYECDGDTKPCELYKDKSLFVELPCAFGEKLYIPVIGTDVVIDTKLIAIGVDEDGDVVYNPYEYSADTFGISGGEIGKTVFLTKEEAERKLKEVGE